MKEDSIMVDNKNYFRQVTRLLTLLFTIGVMIFSAASTQATVGSINLLTNPGAETSNLSGWHMSSSGEKNWINGNPSVGAIPEARSGNWLFCPGKTAADELYQDVNISKYKSGTLTLSGWMRDYTDYHGDVSSLRLELRDSSGKILSSKKSAEVTMTTTWTKKSISLTIPSGAVTARVVLVAKRNSGSDCDSYFDDLSLTYDANTKKTDYMAKLGVTKGIKVGKAYKFSTMTDVVGKSSGTWTLNKIKVSNASKKGYKKLTFTVIWKNNCSPTQNQVDQLWEYAKKHNNTSYVGVNMCAVVDKYTGIDLEEAAVGKKYDVTVTAKKETYRKTLYCSNRARSIIFTSKWKADVTIVFPENYDGLCIGFGTSNKKNFTTADNQFFKGKVKFEKTSFWKAGKNYTRWLDISSIM